VSGALYAQASIVWLVTDNNLIEIDGITMANENGTSNDHELELAAAIVEALNLDIQPEQIDPTARLYGEGLGLDSIDMLEISLVVSKKYGVQLRSDDPENVQIFSSLRNLNAYIQSKRTK
jgi:acyl carrier protein